MKITKEHLADWLKANECHVIEMYAEGHHEPTMVVKIVAKWDQVSKSSSMNLILDILKRKYKELPKLIRR